MIAQENNWQATTELVRARKDSREGKVVFIKWTKQGTLELSYSERVYTLRTFGHEPAVVAVGRFAEVRDVLAGLYVCG